jgi:hypothetical protein
MSDTPETDGIEFKTRPETMPPYNTVPAGFARRLERERDEARKEVEFLKKTPLRQRCQELERLSDHYCDMYTIAFKGRSRLRAINAELLGALEECLCDWNEGHGHTDAASVRAGWELILKIREEQP